MLNDNLITTRSKQLDYMRFFLALVVLFMHLIPSANYLQIPVSEFFLYVNQKYELLFQSNGETNPAVLGFIVLSGYCIHRNGFRKNNFDVRNFLIKRFFRIWPVYLLGILLGVFSFFIATKINVDVKTITATSDISILGLVSKILGLFVFIPNFLALSYQGNGPLATVAVEFYLYLFYPFAIYLLNNLKEKYFWFILFTIILSGIICVDTFPSLKSWWHNGSFFGFLFYWYLGVKFISKNFSKHIGNNLKTIMFLWIFLTIILIFTSFGFSIIVEFRKIIFSLMFGYLIHILDQCDRSNEDIHQLSIQNQYLRSLIESSYSLYALHIPVIVFCLALGMRWHITALICLIIGTISYLFLEKPFIQFSKLFVKASRKGALKNREIALKQIG